MAANFKRPDEWIKRRKIISVDPQFILMMLNLASQMQMTVSLPVMDEIPDGTEVVSLFADQSSGRLKLIVAHPSFAEVIPGDVYPEFILNGGEWRVVRIETRKEIRANQVDDNPSPFQRPFTNPRSSMGLPKS